MIRVLDNILNYIHRKIVMEYGGQKQLAISAFFRLIKNGGSVDKLRRVLQALTQEDAAHLLASLDEDILLRLASGGAYFWHFTVSNLAQQVWVERHIKECKLCRDFVSDIPSGDIGHITPRMEEVPSCTVFALHPPETDDQKLHPHDRVKGLDPDFLVVMRGEQVQKEHPGIFFDFPGGNGELIRTFSGSTFFDENYRDERVPTVEELEAL